MSGYVFATKACIANRKKNLLTRMWANPNMMAALPNIGGALCSTSQTLADAYYWMPCSNAAKTRNPLKLPRVPQTNERILAARVPKFTIL